MFGYAFDLNEKVLLLVEEIGRHMPGGFFIYREGGDEEVLYANHAVFEIFGCRDLDEFRELTGMSFRGMVFPDDHDAVTKSIKEQTIDNRDDVDHVEYRIVRKDGAVRWVDDYGHYTMTKAYGGIFYVFISDITEKREQMESGLAVRMAVIEALSNSYHTLLLIDDVESDRFLQIRGDDAHVTDACSGEKITAFSKAVAQYIKYDVAPSDRGRMKRELAMDNIVQRLKEKERFNIGFSRMMPDGTERHYLVEFAGLETLGGKRGVVCGFKDVEDDVREEQEVQKKLHEAAEAKREELEQRLSLQEKLLDEERKRVQQKKLITALSSDYWSVYYVELDKDEGVCYQAHSEIENGLEVGERFSYLQTFTEYAEKYITESFRDEFLRFVHPDSIREGLKEKRIISYYYMVRRNGKESYEMIKFAGVRHPEDRDDHIVHAVGAGFVDVDADTHKSMAQHRAVSDALVAAEEASKAKTVFLSNMSHEIRTPMNAIISLDNIALNDPDIPEKTADYLKKIGASANHLLSIINDILDMSRIESGRTVVKNEEFSFSGALEQVNSIFSGQCRDKHLKYECHIDDKVQDYYSGDETKLKQVLINILGNAVKFTPAGGAVTLDVDEINRYEDKATLRFIIKDTGIGIGKDFLPKIFDAFAQEDSTITNKYGSTGLGMPITKSLVELMNGNIKVESEKGKGTTFTVVLTLEKAKEMSHQVVADARSLKDLSVLVIDDDKVARDHARLVLQQAGAFCDVTASGAEGVEAIRLRNARRNPYDLILVDWKMPGMSGMEVTKEIRNIAGEEPPVVIVTSYNWDDIADQANEADVDSFVAKPMFASSVMEALGRAMQKKGDLQPAKKADLKGRRILLAEDVAINAEIMVMVLSMREIEADHAENGRIAVEKFSQNPVGYYDAILMDMRMPEMNGLQATAAIRAMKREDAARIPIIALTANAFDEDVQRSMQAGLNAHLSKPVEPDVLFQTLESLIEP